MTAMLISGTLAHHAELRTRMLDAEGHAVPVICFDLLTNSPARMPVHVEWPQAADGYHAAEQLTKTLKRGATVTVQAPLVGLRLVVTNASEVHASAPAEASTSPVTHELF